MSTTQYIRLNKKNIPYGVLYQSYEGWTVWVSES